MYEMVTPSWDPVLYAIPTEAGHSESVYAQTENAPGMRRWDPQIYVIKANSAQHGHPLTRGRDERPELPSDINV